MSFLGTGNLLHRPEVPEVTCSRCGKPLAITGDAPFVRCLPCGSTYARLGEEVFPYQRLATRVNLADAGRRFQQWMADTLGPAGLDGIAVMGEPRAYDLLFWSFTRADLGLASQVLVPAVPTALPEVRYLEMDTSELMAAAAAPDMEETGGPTVPRETAWREAGGAGPMVEGNGAILRLPVYEFPYTFNGRGYRVIVDGVTGGCRAERWPQRSNAGLVLALVACLAAFLLEGWVLWGQGGWLALAYLATAIPAAVVTYYVLRSRDRL